jgi:hypothetical protein
MSAISDSKGPHSLLAASTRLHICDSLSRPCTGSVNGFTTSRSTSSSGSPTQTSGRLAKISADSRSAALLARTSTRIARLVTCRPSTVTVIGGRSSGPTVFGVISTA